MKKLLIIFLFFSWTPFAHAAIAFDATAQFFNNAGATNVFDFTHTVTGSNTALIACVGWDNRGGQTITSVTYNAVSMNSVAATRGGSFDSIHCYLLVGAATGAHTVEVTMSGAITGATKQIMGISDSYTGVSQTGQPDSVGGNSSTSGTNFPVSTTVVASNSWIMGAAIDLNGEMGTSIAGTGTTYRTNQTGINMIGADSNGTVGTGSQTLNYGTAGGQLDAEGVTISLAPVASASSPQSILASLLQVIWW